MSQRDKPETIAVTLPEVKGCIGWVGEYVYYTDGRDVWKAHRTNVVDTRTGYLIGRWECSVHQWNIFPHIRQGLPKIHPGKPRNT